MFGLRLACMWPGLARTWYQGSAIGLFVSVLYAWVICLLLLASFVWPQWLSAWLVSGLWFVAITTWFWSVTKSHFRVGNLVEVVDEQDTAVFAAAQEDYLKGNWFDAEAKLLGIVQKKPSDIAARLLIVGVFRHTHRHQVALKHLEQLELLDAANSWFFEIRRERALIAAEMPDGHTIEEEAKPDDAVASETAPSVKE